MEYRSKELARLGLTWEQRDTLHTWEDGYTLDRLHTPADLVLEGGIMGHCASNHALWIRENVEFMFSLRNPDAISKATIHCKATEWWGKEHPLDKELTKEASYGPVADFEYGHSLEDFCGTKYDGIPAGLVSTYYDPPNYAETYGAYKKRITFEGVELVVVSVASNYGERESLYLNKCYEWLNAHGADYTLR